MKTIVLAAVVIGATTAAAGQSVPPALSEYIYAVPNGWTTTVAPDGILLRALTSGTPRNTRE